MATRSRGRGTAGLFGFLLLAAGLIGAGVMFYVSTQRPKSAVDSFARAAAGCTTTLEFQDAGDFFVYQEVDAGGFEPTDGCAPSATPGRQFDFTLTGPARVQSTTDRSVSYDSGDFAGSSVARFSITEPGFYEIAVVADDVTAVAAVGRDPDDGVAGLRRNALIIGIIGVLLGLLLLVLAGRRSHTASKVTMPEGPGWGHRAQPSDTWPPTPPTVPRMAINPQQPDTPAVAAPPPPPLPAREPGAGLTMPSWAPPGAAAQPVSSDAPAPPPPPRAPQPIPVLPGMPPPGVPIGLNTEEPDGEAFPPPPPPPPQ